jgi:hypothetical protein
MNLQLAFTRVIVPNTIGLFADILHQHLRSNLRLFFALEQEPLIYPLSRSNDHLFLQAQKRDDLLGIQKEKMVIIQLRIISLN